MSVKTPREMRNSSRIGDQQSAGNERKGASHPLPDPSLRCLAHFVASGQSRDPGLPAHFLM